MDSERVCVSAAGIEPEQFDALRERWRELEDRSRAHYATSHQWLSAWIAAYRPRRLVLIEITRGTTLIGLGLLERLRGRRLRFAGAPVTPRACLLTDAREDAEAWRALAEHLRHSAMRWSLVQCSGAPASALCLPRAVGEPVQEYVIELPEDYDTYFSDRSANMRKSVREKQRRISRTAEIAEVPSERTPEALREFVRLHHERASDQGERHPSVDARLARLLTALAGQDGDIRVRIFELCVGDRVVGTSIRLDHGDVAYSYNGGFDPAFGRLSPGISLRIASIHHAIATGIRHFDLGPGEYAYKADLGGVPFESHNVVSMSPVLPRSAIGLARRARSLRRTASLRGPVLRRAGG